MDYHIYHMFPQLLNLYGDHGNIITLEYFARELGLNPIVHNIEDVSDIDWDEVDFMLLGGGSDREQAIVTQHLDSIKDKLKESLEAGLPILAVCGGYQFLGNYYQDSNGTKLPGLGLLNMETIAQTKTRIVGNTIVKSAEFEDIIGFVNHAGETFHELEYFGVAKYGYGNNLTTKNEGVRYKNLIGTYLHGPLLPKNPHITLFYLELFMKKHNLDYDFSKLDLTMEQAARNNMIKKIESQV